MYIEKVAQIEEPPKKWEMSLVWLIIAEVISAWDLEGSLLLPNRMSYIIDCIFDNLSEMNFRLWELIELKKQATFPLKATVCV